MLHTPSGSRQLGTLRGTPTRTPRSRWSLLVLDMGWPVIRGWSNTVGNLNEGFRVTKYVFCLKKWYGFNESALPNSTLSTVFHQSLMIWVDLLRYQTVCAIQHMSEGGGVDTHDTSTHWAYNWEYMGVQVRLCVSIIMRTTTLWLTLDNTTIVMNTDSNTKLHVPKLCVHIQVVHS